VGTVSRKIAADDSVAGNSAASPGGMNAEVEVELEVLALPTRRITPHWYLREDWEVSWTPDQGHGTSMATELGRKWAKPQSAAVGVVRSCTTGGDALAASHWALPRSEFYYAPCDDMGRQERVVLTMTVIADALGVLRAELAQVVCPGVAIAHGEFINEKKLQPGIDSLQVGGAESAAASFTGS